MSNCQAEAVQQFGSKEAFQKERVIGQLEIDRILTPSIRAGPQWWMGWGLDFFHQTQVTCECHNLFESTKSMMIYHEKEILKSYLCSKYYNIHSFLVNSLDIPHGHLTNQYGSFQKKGVPKWMVYNGKPY